MSSKTNTKIPVLTNKFAKEKAEIDFGIGPLENISQDLVDHLEKLTEDVEVDLDTCLSQEDDEEDREYYLLKWWQLWRWNGYWESWTYRYKWVRYLHDKYLEIRQ